MSRHQAYRNYDYENDLDEFEGADYDDEDEDELGAEDRAQMTAGTAQVRAALGNESSKITSKQIEEALWHYYYDVDKSVAYLVGKYVAPKPANKNTAEGLGGQALSGRFSFANFFHDMPWLNIPKERETIFIAPHYPQGLLGGAGASGKMSKLQALAAARKKKAEEHQNDGHNVQQATQNLAKLSLPTHQHEKAKENVQPLSEAIPDTNGTGRRNSSMYIGPEAQEKTHGNETNDAAYHNVKSSSSFDDQLLSTRAEPPKPPGPSAFAQALLGPSHSSSPSPPKKHYFQLPYMSITSSVADAFSEPSPDDKVLAAQSKASNKTLAASTKKKGGNRDGTAVATDGVKNLKIDDTPLPKSKNLNVLNEFEKSKSKRSASFVVVGHVDAGKSTLMGRLLLDLDVVDQRTIQKYRKEAESIGKSSFALAWVLDQRSEERSRGVTIDIATNKFETEQTSFTILDAPGHRDFIPNMIAGASQADFAILVVDAATGAFEAGLKGQTREHALLLRSMGVSRIIVAINKLDTVSWSQTRFDEISQQVSGFLSATGFQLKNVSFVPVSGLCGDNLVNKSQDPSASWYTGNTLIAELEGSEPINRALDKPLRMTISEVFRSTQSPLTVSGRIDAGSLQAGDALLVQPSGEKAYVKSLELDSEPVDWAVAGQNVVIHLSNIDPIHVRVGDIICDPKQPVPCLDTFTIKVLAFDILMPMQVDVHRGRLHAAGQIVEISATLDKIKGTILKRKPKLVKPGSVARVVIKIVGGGKTPLEVGQRVVLRSGGETVAAGLLE
ncbi:P-loop containing nucleoside triphosphate hydrolase protein [Xylariaceae sp. FL0016]|nr:P-loop containing nucleoside triphosphate hydrolase protein [Xylariaceae sp. FL0016]